MERRPLTTQRTTTRRARGLGPPGPRAPGAKTKGGEGGRANLKNLASFVASPLPERCQWTRARMRTVSSQRATRCSQIPRPRRPLRPLPRPGPGLPTVTQAKTRIPIVCRCRPRGPPPGPGRGGRYNVLRGESNVAIVPAIRGYAAEDIYLGEFSPHAVPTVPLRYGTCYCGIARIPTVPRYRM